MFCEKLLEIEIMSTHIFYKENLPYKSRFSNRKLLNDKASKKNMNICSEGPFTPFPPWIYICFEIQQSLIHMYVWRMYVLRGGEITFLG